MKSARGSRGFTLVELLVVVAIVGILVMIAADAFLKSIQRARQSRTLSDMRTLAAGMEAFQIDIGRYPPAAGFTMPEGLTLPAQDIRGAEPYLAPTYIRVVPLADGWASWFDYAVEGVAAQHYVVRSCGKDGIPETAPAWGPTTTFDADIIIVDGAFVQYPEGTQR